MHINRRSLFFKVLGMLSQTWAITKSDGVVLYLNDLGKVIDNEQYASKARAVAGQWIFRGEKPLFLDCQKWRKVLM